MFKYAVVVFQTSNGEEVDAVPLFWLSQERTCCAWPPQSTPIHMVVKAIKSMEMPETDWLQFTVKYLGVYEEYETARKKAKKGEITSDLDTATSGTKIIKSEKRKKTNVDDFPNEDDVDNQYTHMNDIFKWLCYTPIGNH
ncbi:uncharacterized protein LOC124811006 isoform X2 [Hydra vulgaris]|uniref:uncharacterized protein LOC124811006 isoform X2 n=1 Tax=Hydra vulgaris TaxID=6087 RepID=UPI0032EA0DD7